MMLNDTIIHHSTISSRENEYEFNNEGTWNQTESYYVLNASSLYAVPDTPDVFFEIIHQDVIMIASRVIIVN